MYSDVNTSCQRLSRFLSSLCQAGMPNPLTGPFGLFFDSIQFGSARLSSVRLNFHSTRDNRRREEKGRRESINHTTATPSGP